jgi:DNA-binding HxlR family transcriptional regulator
LPDCLLIPASGSLRKVRSQRLQALTEAGVLKCMLYQRRPNRFDHVLTERRRTAIPVLAALQELGNTWLLVDGTTQGIASSCSAESRRVTALVGSLVPPR